MLQRRALLATLAMAGLIPALRSQAAPPPAAPDTPESHALHDLFDRMVQDSLQRHPDFATSLGLDKGKLAPLKSKLSDASLAAAAQDRKVNQGYLTALRGFDRAKLRGIDVASYDTVLFTVQLSEDGAAAIPYAGGSISSPYVVSQLGGAYQRIPDFLDTQTSIETAADAEAYLARMQAFAVVMDQ